MTKLLNSMFTSLVKNCSILRRNRNFDGKGVNVRLICCTCAMDPKMYWFSVGACSDGASQPTYLLEEGAILWSLAEAWPEAGWSCGQIILALFVFIFCSSHFDPKFLEMPTALGFFYHFSLVCQKYLTHINKPKFLV